jgi:RNase P/RNase MRP subunit p29
VKLASVILTTTVCLAFTSCGYHVAGKGELIPQTVKTVAVPAWSNVTTRYKLTDHIPEAISREFLTRTHYKVVSDVNEADMVLRGAVLRYTAYATVVDRTTGRATVVDLHLYLQVSLTERTTGKVLFTRPNFEVRGNYEISVDPAQYFDESDAALERAAQQAAQQVVSSILNNF